MRLTDPRGLPVSTRTTPPRSKVRARRCARRSATSAIRWRRSTRRSPRTRLRDGACAARRPRRDVLGAGRAAADPRERRGLRAHRRSRDRARAGARRRRTRLAGRRLRARLALYGAITVEHPRDLIAMQAAGHVIDFYLGDSIMLRDHVAQALPYWNREVPGYGYLLGMHAFGLEETRQLRARRGRRPPCARARPARPWAVHAVQHVFEMQGPRPRRRRVAERHVAELGRHALAFHNWWHLALHQLELGDIPGRARRVRPPGAPEGERGRARVRRRLAAASRAFRCAAAGRLALGGARGSAGRRRRRAASTCSTTCTRCSPSPSRARTGNQPDARCSGEERARHRDERGERARRGPARRARDRRDGGGPAGEALERLLPIRSRSYRIGGSHAQRDLVQLTVVGAALAAGNGRLARALAAERTEQKPTSPHNWRLTARALEAQGATFEARKASEHAELRRRAQLRRHAA